MCVQSWHNAKWSGAQCEAWKVPVLTESRGGGTPYDMHT
jgi:hypothetical protein